MTEIIEIQDSPGFASRFVLYQGNEHRIGQALMRLQETSRLNPTVSGYIVRYREYARMRGSDRQG